MSKKYNVNNVEEHAVVHSKLLDKGEPFVLAVFAKWCNHCNILTNPQDGKSTSEWDAFKNSSKKLPVVQMEYDTMSKLAQDETCELGRLLAASATSFPFVAVARKNSSLNKLNVHVYDGTYPMTSKSIHEFVKGKKGNKYTRPS